MKYFNKALTLTSPLIALVLGCGITFAQAQSTSTQTLIGQSHTSGLAQIMLAQNTTTEDSAANPDIAPDANDISIGADELEIKPVSDLQPDRDDAVGPSFAKAFEACFSKVSAAAADQVITIKTVLNETGSIQGVPDLISPENPNTADRHLYLSALLFIEDCGPYHTGGQAQTINLTIGPADTLKFDTETNWVAATKSDEAALKLTRRDIAEIQARLMLLDFDPNGIDGSTGKGTRSALSAWQKSQNIPDTGFIDQPQIDALNIQSEPQYAAWIEKSENKAKMEKIATVRKKKKAKTSPWYRRMDGRVCRKILYGTGEYCKLK